MKKTGICVLFFVCVCAAAFFTSCAGKTGTAPRAEAPLPEEDDLYSGVAYALSVGDPAEAIRALEAAQKRDPESLETQQLLVDVLLIAREFDEARAQIGEILKKEPGNQNALYSLSLIESAQGNTAEQKKILARILEINPANDRAQAAMGEILITEKKYADAAKLFNASLEKNPENIVALIGKGNAELRQKKPEEAAKTLTKVIEVQPDYPFAYTDRSKAYAGTGDLEEAEADLSKAIELMPDFAWNYYDRGKLRANAGNTTAALDDLNKAISMDPSIKLAYLYRARIYDGMDNVEAAYADYKKAQSLNPKYKQINVPLAVLEYKKGAWPAAASHFIAASEVEKTEPAHHLFAALCYKKAGNEKQASDYLGRVMGKFPQGGLFYHMARYYMQPSSDLFIVQKVNAEKDKTLRARMLFYLAAQYTLQKNASASAISYFGEASGEEAYGYIENRLASWELAKLEGK